MTARSDVPSGGQRVGRNLWVSMERIELTSSDSIVLFTVRQHGSGGPILHRELGEPGISNQLREAAALSDRVIIDATQKDGGDSDDEIPPPPREGLER